MALNGTIKSSTATSVSSDRYPRHLVLEWSASQSIDNNASTISYTIKAGGNTTSAYCYTGPVTVKINGTTVYSRSDRFKMHSQQVLKTGSITVTHNTDGTMTVPVSISAAIYTYATSSTYSGNITLNTIPRASSIAVSTANIGSNPTINIASASKNFTHTLRYTFGSLSGTIVTKTALTSYTAWTIPTTFYAQIPNSTYGTGTMYCDTYSGNTLVGTKSVSFRVNVSGSNPTLNPTVQDVNDATYALTGNRNTLVRFYSNAQATLGAAAVNGSSIKSYKIVHNSTTVTTSPYTFNKVENGVFNFSVTDTRGLTATKTVTKNIIPYVKLTCAIAKESATPDGDIDVKISGNYFKGSFGAVDNTLTLQYRMKEGSGSYSDWATITTTPGSGSYSVTISKTGLDYRQTYTFQARAIDKIGTVYSVELPIRCLPIFDWGENDFNINVPLAINGSTVLRHNENANNTVLSASGGFIYFRPAGTNDTSNEIKFNPQGSIELSGDIIINGKSLKSLLGID